MPAPTSEGAEVYGAFVMGVSPLDAYGWSDRWRKLASAVMTDGAVVGRVVRQDRGFVLVATESGVVRASVRSRRVGQVVAGDWVVIAPDGRVTEWLERTSLFTRQDPDSGVQPLAANVDLVLVVVGADRPRKRGRIERFLTQAGNAGVPGVIVLTKADLLDDVDAEVADLTDLFPGVPVVPVSGAKRAGIDAVLATIAGGSAVAVGESGAGKSTLLNALVGEDVASTGAVRETDSKGRHTTTRRELHLLEGGGSLIDTPGVRSVGLAADTEDVDEAFLDIADLATRCRFGDCSHTGEPGCAVAQAVEDGIVDRKRVASWRSLTEEVREVAQHRLEAERVRNALRNRRRSSSRDQRTAERDDE